MSACERREEKESEKSYDMREERGGTDHEMNNHLSDNHKHSTGYYDAFLRLIKRRDRG